MIIAMWAVNSELDNFNVITIGYQKSILVIMSMMYYENDWLF